MPCQAYVVLKIERKCFMHARQARYPLRYMSSPRGLFYHLHVCSTLLVDVAELSLGYMLY